MRALLAVVAVATPTVVRAEPNDIVSESLVLARGELALRVTSEIDLGIGIASPLSFAPELRLGASDRLTVALIHGHRAIDLIDVGGSLCVRGCDDVHQDGGLEATYLAHASGALAVAPRARLLMRDFDPAKPATTLGALARWQRGRFAITSDPYLRLGLANHDLGNRAALVVPVWFAVQPTCRWLVALHVGYDADLAVARDGWHGPLGLLVIARPTRHLELGLELGFRSVLGPQNEIRDRAALLTAAWRSRVF